MTKQQAAKRNLYQSGALYEAIRRAEKDFTLLYQYYAGSGYSLVEKDQINKISMDLLRYIHYYDKGLIKQFMEMNKN